MSVKRMIAYLFVWMFCALLSVTGYSVEFESENAVVIDGPIGRGNILKLGKHLIQVAQSGQKQVDMVINSPGGEVVTGFLFINAMEYAKSQGLRIRCFVPDVAASMAFSILTHCNERYALKRSFLLWHRARVVLGGLFGAAMTGPQLTTIGLELESLDKLILKEVLATVRGQNEMWIRYHFEAETLHVAEQLAEASPKFLKAVDTVDGLYEAMTDKRIKRSSPEDRISLEQPGRFIYIAPVRK